MVSSEPVDLCIVVVNHEEQYSVWPTRLELPSGWRMAGPTGSRSECLDYIESHWTDIRPLSMRESAR
jgi:MbtH protein